jgi:FkbM family methyltransferase
MTPLYTALNNLLKNPKDNWRKVIPYTKSHWEITKRNLAEYFGNDTYSKPYQGHDELLKEITKTDGFFVQCGGSDGVSSDPTYYLEKFMKWKGVIAEPLPKTAELCKRNRPNSKVYQTALVSNDYRKEDIELFDCHSMSVTPETKYDIEEWTKKGEIAQRITTKKITVPAMTLDAMIANFAGTEKIDLLVLDTEGSEIAILNGFSLDRYAPQYILIEIIDEQLLRPTIEELFSKKYTLVSRIGYADYLYKLK